MIVAMFFRTWTVGLISVKRDERDGVCSSDCIATCAFKKFT